jgi:hypothetical protein
VGRRSAAASALSVCTALPCTPQKHDAKTIALLLQAAAKSVIWGGINFELPTSEYFLVWDKEQTVDNFASAELAYTNAQIPAKVFHYSIHQHNANGKDGHPTQKPLALMKWCISLFPDARTVLDPYCGSGTTLVAAKSMGLTAIGIELHEPYCEIAAKRLSQEVFSFEAQVERLSKPVSKVDGMGRQIRPLNRYESLGPGEEIDR